MINRCFLFIAMLLPFSFSQANSLDSPSNKTINSLEKMTLLVKQGELVHLPKAAKAIFIADPTIASYQAPSSNSLFIFGHSAGTTSLYVLGKDEQVIYSRQVQVKHDIDGLAKIIKQQFPDSNVKPVSTASRLLLTGTVTTPRHADQIARLAEGFLANAESANIAIELINQLSIDLPTQVNIRIRIAEMDRETSREFGFDNTLDLSYTVPLKTLALTPNTLSGKLKALEAESLISILAEPNLTAVSGEQAQFLAGGQFPIFITGNNGEITIEYKDYGISLDMLPTILSPERINLKVTPKVSELSDKSLVLVDGFSLPSLTTRSASTTVELASGQSFILGGLLHERENTVLSEIPLLADIPVLGMLFRSEKYVRKESELVIIATAYIVEPSRENNFQIPQHDMKPYDHWQRYLYGRILKPMAARKNLDSNVSNSEPKIIGDYGFIF